MVKRVVKLQRMWERRQGEKMMITSPRVSVPQGKIETGNAKQTDHTGLHEDEYRLISAENLNSV